MKGYLTVFSGVCLHMVLGGLYLWGNIMQPVLSFFNKVHGNEAATESIGVGIIPICVCVSSLMIPVGSFLQKRYNPKIILAAGSTIMMTGMFFASYCTTWWIFFYFYVIQFSVGVGLCYYVPI